MADIRQSNFPLAIEAVPGARRGRDAGGRFLLGLAFFLNPLQQAALLVAPVVLMAGVIAASMPGQRRAALRHLSLYLLTDRLSASSSTDTRWPTYTT